MNKSIYLAGGCFWGVEEYFRRTDGIINTRVGYANGDTLMTSYYDLKRTGHAETVEIVYDDNILPLNRLLALYFSIIDPVSVNRQGGDSGTQYRTGIYYTDEADRAVIDIVMDGVRARCDKPVAVEVEPLKNFIEAEDYHQQYLAKNPGGYCHIKLPNKN